MEIKPLDVTFELHEPEGVLPASARKDYVADGKAQGHSPGRLLK
jgi:hypothetical protein